MNDDQNKIIEGLTKITSTLFEEVIQLKSESQQFKGQIEAQNNTIRVLLDNQKTLTEALDKSKFENKMLAETLIRSVNNVPYELNMGLVPVPKIADIYETLDALVENKMSLSRYGDGEFSIMAGHSRQGFQRQSDELAKKLIETFECNEKGFMVTIANNYGPLYEFDEECRKQIRYYMTESVRIEHNTFINQNRMYYNTHMTSAYQMSKPSDYEKVDKFYKKVKMLWEDRNVVVVEGSLSRVGVGNDFFDNSKSISRILCPPEQAFDRYKEILEKSIKFGNKTENPIFLVFLGPTATVLAYDLFKAGFQALDLGHIDVDYILFKNKTKDLNVIKGKHINNFNTVDDVEEVDNPLYKGQIVANISR